MKALKDEYAKPLFDGLHRALTGQTLTGRELRFAAIFVGVWFLMDLIQFVDWALEKMR